MAVPDFDLDSGYIPSAAFMVNHQKVHQMKEKYSGILSNLVQMMTVRDCPDVKKYEFLDYEKLAEIQDPNSSIHRQLQRDGSISEFAEYTEAKLESLRRLKDTYFAWLADGHSPMLMTRELSDPATAELRAAIISKLKEGNKQERWLMTDLFVNPKTSTRDFKKYILVVFGCSDNEGDSVDANAIRRFLSILLQIPAAYPNEGDCPIDEAIFVTNNPINSSAANKLSAGFVGAIKFQHFVDKELTINPLTSSHTSKTMRILQGKERDDLAAILKTSMLPPLGTNAPDVKYIGALEGDLIEIYYDFLIPGQQAAGKLFYGIVNKAFAQKV